MMAQLIDRRQMKAETNEILKTAQVSPKAMTALYLGLGVLFALVDDLTSKGAAVVDRNLIGIFVFVMISLLNTVLGAGYTMYCMAVRRGERVEFLSLFDGFSFAGKIIALTFIQGLLVSLWTMLFIVPGIIAFYRYRFALYNLYENPNIGILEALDMSKQQTMGYKTQLFFLDMSYIGWIVLAMLPALALDIYITSQNVNSLMSGSPLDATFGGFLWLVLLVCNLWDAAVAVFYLPNYQCTDVGYFEIAKKTSGVGAKSEASLPAHSWSDDTDDSEEL